ncbi:SufE family protein [soil metagenome]
MTYADTLRADFELLDDWEDRYRYIIELGRALPPLADADRTPENKVRGCASQVWIASRVRETGGEPVLELAGDSDALIVKGLIAIVFGLYSGKPAREIAGIDAQALLDSYGLKDHLTPQRSNGLASMIARIKADARAAAAVS